MRFQGSIAFVIALALAAAARPCGAQERLMAPPPTPAQRPASPTPGPTWQLPAPGGMSQPSGRPPLVAPMTLNAATDLALANSPALRQAQARIGQMQGLALQAGLYPNPQQNSGNPNQLGGRNSLYSTGISQEIVRGGKLRLSMAAAEQAVRQANLEYMRARYDLLTAVRVQFFTLLANQNRVRALSELYEVTRKSEDTATKLREQGQAAEGDVLLLRMERRRIETVLRSSEFARLGGTRQLAAVIGLSNMPIDRIEGDLAARMPDFANLAEQARLLATSATLENARADIARNQWLLRRAEAEPTPNVILNGGYQWTVDQPHSQALVGMYFTMPLWDRNQGNIRAAEANVSASVAQLGTVQNDLARQAAEALARYQAADNTVKVYEQGILADARKSLENARQLYNAGQMDLIRMLETQRLSLDATVDYINALQERLTSAATLAGLLQLDQFP